MGQQFEKKISQCRKLSHSTKNTLFHILIHCETILYPYTLPKTLFYYIAETIPYLNTLPKLYPIHRRNIPYLNTWPEDPSRPWARVGCYSLSLYMEGPLPPPIPSDQLRLLLLTTTNSLRSNVIKAHVLAISNEWAKDLKSKININVARETPTAPYSPIPIGNR